MVVNLRSVTVNNDSGKASYFLRETQPEWERDQDLEYQFKLKNSVEFMFLKEMPEYAKEAFGFNEKSDKLTQYELIKNMVGGRRLDGKPTGRRQVSEYTRADGKTFSPIHYHDLVLQSDISVGIALMNCATPGARSLLLTAALDADEAAVRKFAEHAGFVRYGAGGRGGSVPGQLLIARVTHHCTRPTQTGFVAPNLHNHHIISNWVVGEQKSSVLYLKDFKKTLQSTFDEFHNKLANNFNKIGVATRTLEGGSTAIAAVPEKLREHFAQRRAEILERAHSNAAEKGLNYNELSEKQKASFKNYAARQTRGSAYDGVADTHGWRLASARFGWNAADLPRAVMALLPAVMDGSTATLLDRSDALRRGAVMTWQATRQVVEGNRLASRPALSVRLKRDITTLSRALTHTLAMAPATLSMRAELLAGDMRLTAARVAQKASVLGERLKRKPTLVPILTELNNQIKRIEYMQPRQFDHDSLGAYLAMKHRLPATMGPDIAAAGQAVQGGQEPLSNAFNRLIMKAADHNDTASSPRLQRLEIRLDKAITESAGFYDKTKIGQSFTTVGKTDPNKPVLIAKNYGDAALVHDATKLAVVVTYTEANTARMVARIRESHPNQQIMVVGNNRNEPELAKLNQKFATAVALPPDNQSGANSWQQYAKNYGTEAVAQSLRQTFKQEFRQGPQGPAQSMRTMRQTA